MNEHRRDEEAPVDQQIKRASRVGKVIAALSLAVTVAAISAVSGILSGAKYFAMISIVTSIATALFGATTNASLNRLMKAANRLLQNDASRHSAKQLALSVLYLNHLSRKNQPVKLLVVVTGSVTAGLGFWLANPNLYYLSSVTMTTAVLIMVKESIVGYRIRAGFFGTNRNEARAFLKFLIRNAADIDFTDSNGKLRQALQQPQALSDRVEQGAGGGATA